MTSTGGHRAGICHLLSLISSRLHGLRRARCYCVFYSISGDFKNTINIIILDVRGQKDKKHLFVFVQRGET